MSRVIRYAETHAAHVYLERSVSSVLEHWSYQNCSKYDGNLTFDVRRWLKTLSIMLDIRQAHPDIWHLVGFCLIEGSARERLLLVIGSDDEPKNWDSFCKWTLSLNTLDPEVINAYNKRVVADDYEDLHQGKNETVEEFYTRFMKWQCKARYHGYEHDPETMFVNRLKKGLRRKISGLIAIENRRGTPMSFNIVVEAALDEDRAYGSTALIEIPASPHKFPRVSPMSEGSIRTASEPQEHFEKDVGRILNNWPYRDCPTYNGYITFDVQRWLRRLSVLLKIRQAHPDIWHLVGFRLIEGDALRSLGVALLSDNPPSNWASFSLWANRLNSLGPDVVNTFNQSLVHRSCRMLCQHENEKAQSFYQRFLVWKANADYHDYIYDPATTFVNALSERYRPSITHQVALAKEHGTPMSFAAIVHSTISMDFMVFSPVISWPPAREERFY
ncbi:hypothetical protein MJO28_009610 [Puccinia striiformis f. sp. tritici]|uniref:Retrotransposon gag domain-containing protein n=4 Tax=Puccinia striiformis TaxID=27350 RepID=A0A2S4WA90_9BASI|nr:hypothetical protein MJO28_009610 [Puccinia striiformis f. sp. tritici]KAI7950733.1 hypothetical protein MJO29_009407 [Puccinia striiformis f. sp. tritici]KAI9615275.1 hypothetical protein KEM48_005703 [Puccinia striiformis f. sp. tritici PST-130]POW18668.1 hypothetical protein PSHT_05472 [Puccinia striiformis]